MIYQLIYYTSEYEICQYLVPLHKRGVGTRSTDTA